MRHLTELVVLACCCCASVFCVPLEDVNSAQHRRSVYQSGVPRVPEADGLLHIYALPVGQGNSHVVQCPSGDLSIVDLGSSQNLDDGFWHVPELISFFQGQYDKIYNVILTHSHFDHYSFLPEVLSPSVADLSAFTNFYTTCTFDFLATMVQEWLNQVDPSHSKIRLFNGGQPCGQNGIACDGINLCPNDPAVTVKVMTSNTDQCSGDAKNVDSLVFKVMHGDVSIMFDGDFEDYTSNPSEFGPQKAMVDYYGAEMAVTVYKLCHHGASYLANKPVFQHAVLPKAIFASSNPWYGYEHPRCLIIDGFIDDVQTLCKPDETDVNSPYYCGDYPLDNVPSDDRVQRTYTCGESGDIIHTIHNNDLAIFTTTPDDKSINVVDLVSDGSRWGFINTITSRAAPPLSQKTRERRSVDGDRDE